MSKSSVLCSFLTIVLLSVFSASTVFGKQLVATEADNGKVLKLSKGDMLSIKLPAQLGTGYSWEVKAYSKRSLRYLGAKEETEKSGPGAISTQVFTFEARAKESSFVTIVYRRPFEKNRPTVIKVFKVSVKVS